MIVENFALETPKTKAFRDIMLALQVGEQRLLAITGEHDKTLYLSCRNLPKVNITPAKDLNTYQIMQAGVIVIAENAIKGIIENCGVGE